VSVPSPRLSQLQRLIAAYRQSILTLDDAALARLQAAYGPSRERLLSLIEALTGQISAGGKLTTSEAMELGRARELLRLVEVESGKLARLTGEIVPSTQAQAVAQALERARRLTIASGLDTRSAARVAARWTSLNSSAVTDLVGSLSDGSPLADWIERVVPESVQTVRDTLLDGVARGINPEDLARALAQATDLPLQRAMTTTRSVVMDAYRSASIQSYQQNAELLSGWTWLAAHDSTVCSACLALSGQDFDLSVSFMPSHRNCRCSPAPKLKDDSLLPQLETGQEWFDRQPESVRRNRFPVGLRADYDAGRVGLQDMVHLHRDDTWGDSYQVATISQARESARRGRRDAA